MPRISNEAIASLTYEEVLELYATQGGERAAARYLGVPRTSLQDHFRKLKTERFTERRAAAPLEFSVSSGVQWFILSSAQDGTKVHRGFLSNLEAYAKFRDNAKILISGFSYNKHLFEDHSKHHTWYDPSIAKYLTQTRVNIGPRLTFCGEQNTLPTAVQPLSGFDAYTRDRSGIFPHPKVHLKSIATAKGDHAKILMTTGAVTLPNYVQKKAGIKAEFNHEIGAVIVALLPDGNYFARHILAEADGSFQDLTWLVKDGEVTGDNKVEAITFGDIHREKKVEHINAALWGVDGEATFEPMIDYLEPDYQFIHDIIDFKVRNHHNIKDPHFRFQMFVEGTDSVEDSMEDAVSFLYDIQRGFCTTVVVESNHDLALTKWLKTADYRDDPANARYFLELQLATYKAIEAGETEFQPLKYAFEKTQTDIGEIRFLHEDDSFVIAGGIEGGQHGHNGSNGTPGSGAQFARAGRRSNTAHTHSAAIIDGAYVAGVTGSLDMGYNRGLSSWSHSHIVTYPSGKRAIITQLPDGLYCEDVIEWETA